MLKKALLSAMLFCSLNLFSQEKLNVYTDAVSFFGVRPSIGSVEIGSKYIDASFLFGSYNVRAENLNDSIYREIVTCKFPLKRLQEVFLYEKKDSGYNFVSYDAVYGNRRESKDSLFFSGVNFSNKMLNPVDFVKALKKESLEGKVDFFLLGNSFSVDLKKRVKGEEVFYSANLEDVVRREDEDAILFDSDVRVSVASKKIDGFVTSFSKGEDSKRHFIEGKRVE